MNTDEGEAYAWCPPGKVVTGGGFHVFGDADVTVSQPFSPDFMANGRYGWHASVLPQGDFFVQNGDDVPGVGVTAYAICAFAAGIAVVGPNH